MHFATRSKVGTLLSLLVLAIVVSSFVLNGLFSHPTAIHAASVQAYNATKGILTPSATVNLKELPTANLSHAPGIHVPRGYAIYTGQVLLVRVQTVK